MEPFSKCVLKKQKKKKKLCLYLREVWNTGETTLKQVQGKWQIISIKCKNHLHSYEIIYQLSIDIINFILIN